MVFLVVCPSLSLNTDLNLSLPLSLTLLYCHPVLKLLNHVTCHTLCADWLALLVKFDDCNLPEMFYYIMSPIHHAFTYQIMLANDDFKAPSIHPHSHLSHIMFDI